jgi:hypothetical protein
MGGARPFRQVCADEALRPPERGNALALPVFF